MDRQDKKPETGIPFCAPCASMGFERAAMNANEEKYINAAAGAGEETMEGQDPKLKARSSKPEQPEPIERLRLWFNCRQLVGASQVIEFDTYVDGDAAARVAADLSAGRKTTFGGREWFPWAFSSMLINPPTPGHILRATTAMPNNGRMH